MNKGVEDVARCAALVGILDCQVESLGNLALRERVRAAEVVVQGDYAEDVERRELWREVRLRQLARPL